MTAGTIFEGTRKPLRLWFQAMWSVTNQKHGVSALGLQRILARIVDNFQVYLRELRPEELSGTKGVVRLKEELLVRVNGAVDPIKVYDILFKEILVQG